MSKSIGYVKFLSGNKLFLVYNNTVSSAYPYLYDTAEQAQSDYENNFASRISQSEEDRDNGVEEPVYLYSDCDEDEDYDFTTLVSLDKMIITHRIEGCPLCLDWMEFYQDLANFRSSVTEKIKLRIIQTRDFDAFTPLTLILHVIDSAIPLSSLNTSNLPEFSLLEINISPDEYWKEDLSKKAIDLLKAYLTRHGIDFDPLPLFWHK